MAHSAWRAEADLAVGGGCHASPRPWRRSKARIWASGRGPASIWGRGPACRSGSRPGPIWGPCGASWADPVRMRSRSGASKASKPPRVATALAVWGPPSCATRQSTAAACCCTSAACAWRPIVAERASASAPSGRRGSALSVAHDSRALGKRSPGRPSYVRSQVAGAGRRVAARGPEGGSLSELSAGLGAHDSESWAKSRRKTRALFAGKSHFGGSGDPPRPTS